MARPRKNSTSHRFSPGQAVYVLERLVRERLISRTDVSRIMGGMQREIEELEERLASLRDAAGRAISAVADKITGRRRGRPPGGGVKRSPGRPASQAATTGAKVGRKRRRRGTKVTAERRASQQLQGRYLGLIRQIPASRRAQYQKIAKDRGREAAIREMSSVLGK